MGGVRLAVSLSVFARPTPSASDGPLDEDLPLVPAGMGAPGSNPGVPTKQTPTKTNLPGANPRCFRTFREITRGSRFSSCWLLLVFFRVRIRTQVRTHDWIPRRASRTRPAGPPAQKALHLCDRTGARVVVCRPHSGPRNMRPGGDEGVPNGGPILDSGARMTCSFHHPSAVRLTRGYPSARRTPWHLEIGRAHVWH